MDSGNSGSLQSSSGGAGVGDGGVGGGGGGDDVFDSRKESISSFLNPSTHFNPTPILHHHHHQHHQLQPPPETIFDPSSFSQSLNPNPDLIYNLESLWSRNVRPDSSYTNFESTRQDPYLDPAPVDDNLNRSCGTEQIPVTTKNPKKRTRASRRAPTTVLTTDTSNFRQMVQEFTGIPAGPFAGSSSSSSFSRRIDLYGGGIAPVHHLRPSAQKIQLQQQQPSYLNSATATTSNFQLHPSDSHGFPKQPLDLSSLQNPRFPFQSLSQTTLGQQLNATESDNQRSEPLNALPNSSSKRWRGQDETLMNFEGGNGNNQDGVVSSRSDGDQLPGNEDSWIN